MSDDRRCQPVIVVAGPTASGKSAVADIVAQKLGSEVVSADAMQVYRGMDIGTAKTPVAERTVPLQMVDIVEPQVAYSAACYQRDARNVLDRILASGRPPVLCGGTGLYIRAAIDDMHFPSGELEDDRRAHYQELAKQLGDEGIHALLAERDPESAACIHPNNVRRTIRALEMLDDGVSYAVQKARFSVPQAQYPSIQFALTMNRSRLYRRIDERVDTMMTHGLVAEVASLIAQGARDALTARQAIGYKEIISAFDGVLSMDRAVELIKQRSRRYAKRQISWFKRDQRITWLDMDELDPESAAETILERLAC